MQHQRLNTVACFGTKPATIHHLMFKKKKQSNDLHGSRLRPNLPSLESKPTYAQSRALAAGRGEEGGSLNLGVRQTGMR